jgi:FkbM family methyltransferase
MSLISNDKKKNSSSTYERFLQSLLLRVRPAPIASLLKRILRVHRVVFETSSGRFWIDPISNFGMALSRDGVYELGMKRTLEEYLKTGMTFIDLGANEAYFTVLAANQVGRSGRVIAIEPQERLLPIIDKNLRLNDADWVTVINVAITNASGLVTIHLAADTNTGASGQYRMAKYRLATQEVQARTLSQILDEKKIGHVDLMKVDIEGAEYEVLLGSPEVFEEGRIRAIALELHPTILAARGKEVSDITDMLTRNGYRQIKSFGSNVWERLS